MIYAVCRRSAAVMFRVFYRTVLVDPEHMPDRGPVLIVANHQSFFDPPLVGCWWRKPMTFIARAGLYTSAPMRWLLRQLNTIPIAEEGSDAAAIRAALEALAAGRMVVVFPEGSRTPDGRVQEFKRGVSVLVKRARCPVVPVGLDGAFDAWPRSRKLPQLFGHRFAVAYGRPLTVEQLEAEGRGALALIEREVRSLQARAAEALGRGPSAASEPGRASEPGNA